jgi:hypothetical protein
MRKAKTKLKYFLGLSLGSLLMLILIFSALPAILLLFKVPSFTFGEGVWWILRWKNETTGSGISFNLYILICLAITIGLLGLLWRSR